MQAVCLCAGTTRRVRQSRRPLDSSGVCEQVDLHPQRQGDPLHLAGGGFLGLGDKYFAVPWDALQLTEDQKAVVLDVSKKDLKQAPGFDKNNWPDLGSRDTAIVIYEFYEVPLPDETPPMKK